MARSRKDLQELAGQLAALSREERARVFALASISGNLRSVPTSFRIPILAGGSAWVGGTLRREDLYDIDGR